MTDKLRKPSTPGEILKAEYMKPLNLTNKELAAGTGLPEGSISPLLQGRGRVTCEVAYRLAKYLDTTPMFWLELQYAVDSYVLKSDAFKMRQINAIVPVTEPLPVTTRQTNGGRPSRK